MLGRLFPSLGHVALIVKPFFLSTLFERLTTRKALIGLGALLFTLLLSQTSLFHRFDNDAADMQARLLARPQNLDSVVIVDVDEESMALLQPLLGAWPYRRDVYAAVTDFLRSSGAKSITYDILFSEPRAGDADFARSLAKADNVVLAASAINYPFERSAEYRTQLDAAAWPAEQNKKSPYLIWRDITLPLPLFTQPLTASQTGVISLRPDTDDGIHRRIPLLHHAYGKTLPSLALASLFAGQPTADIKISEHNQILSINNISLPITADGEAYVQFPANASSFKVLSFYQLVHAAFNVAARPELNYPGAEAIARQIKDKRIFIGSRAAVLGDYVSTPIDAKYPGLFMLALSSQAIEQNKLLAPRNFALDILLMLLAVIVPLILFEQRARRSAAFSLIPLLLMGALITVVSCVFYVYKQNTSLFFPLIAGLLTYLMLLVLRGLSLYLEKQKLGFEKMAAEEAYELKSRFMSHMTHELRTPLTAIIGFNKLLDDKKIDAKTHLQYTGLVDKNGQHLLSLINNILDQARIEAGQMNIVPTPTVLRDIVEDAAATLAQLAQQKNLMLTTTYAQDMPSAYELDGFRLRQILLNLAGNAIKFTEHGSVKINCAWKNNQLDIEIADTGPGLSKDALDRIFVAFEQADEHVAKAHGGSGLGLTISKNLAQLMGGRISVASQVGLGTQFTLHLPLTPCAAPLVATTQQVEAELPMMSGHILLADDNPDLRDLIELYLTRQGLQVSTAENGQDAVRRALHDSPDLILMDLEMPVLGGIGAIDQLRTLGYTGPILALTGHNKGAETARALAAGCNGAVTKPVKRDELLLAIAPLLAQRAREKSAN
jgi:signal transduction histidine kinase/CheY-like chemotaxis protein